MFFPRLIYLPVQFFIRDVEINLNFEITCNLGQLWVSGGSLAVCLCSLVVFGSHNFVLCWT